MTLRTKFLLFVVLLHAVLAALAAQLRTVNPALFVGAEVLLLVSLGLSARLYRDFVRPLQLIAAGTAAMRAQDFSLTFRPVGQPEMDQLIEVYNQMLAALRRERVSQHEKSFLLERLIQASPAGILVLDFEGLIEEVNPAAARCLARPAAELRGQRPAALPGEWGAALGALQAGAPQVVQLSGIRTYRAHLSHFLDRGFARGFIVLEELTQELISQEKRAYEQLIRLMAHEINNSIGAINSILNSFHHYAPQLRAADQGDFREALDVSIARNTHLANFIGGFANLVRLPPPARQPTDVHALLRATARLFQEQSAGQHVVWHWQLAPAPLCVNLDPQQLEQVLINVLKNALEALPPEGGQLTIETELSPPLLRLSNSGAGLTPEVQRRLFTPFFSTKRNGQGLGLTLVRDILLQHGFRFDLATGAPGATAFTVWFAGEEGGRGAG